MFFVFLSKLLKSEVIRDFTVDEWLLMWSNHIIISLLLCTVNSLWSIYEQCILKSNVVAQHNTDTIPLRHEISLTNVEWSPRQRE